MPVADTLEKHSRCSYFSVAAQDNIALERRDNGTAALNGIRVFRAGTFRDSLGIQHTWSAEHLEQMVFHFNMLRNNGVFPNVPWRSGHPGLFSSGGEVVGYFSDLRHEGEFLIADVEITEPTAADKWERGTFRARSLEVGMYETNDESLYWPVVMGCAFVDIPAVEGLYARARENNAVVATVDQEASVTTRETDPNGGGNGGTPDPATPPPPPPDPPAPTPPAPGAQGQNDPAQTAQHGNGSHSFRVAGQPTTDFGAVQRHIDTLEQFASSTRETNRRAFVAALAKDGRIGQPQVESLTAHALSLTDEQYTAFEAIYKDAPKLALFENHGNGTTNPDGQADGDDELDTLKETVAMLSRSGMSQEKVQETSAYKRLQALSASK